MAPVLTVITTSYKRPGFLHHCLEFLRRQETVISFEHRVYLDGPDKASEDVCKQFPEVICRSMGHCGDYGVKWMDLGVQDALGDYVCWFDDDNVYYQHAVQSTVDAARGFDVGVVQILHRQLGYSLVPPQWDGIPKIGDIDTASICVRREVALQYSWTGVRGFLQDFRYPAELCKAGVTFNFSPVVIGVHT